MGVLKINENLKMTTIIITTVQPTDPTNAWSQALREAIDSSWNQEGNHWLLTGNTILTAWKQRMNIALHLNVSNSVASVLVGIKLSPPMTQSQRRFAGVLIFYTYSRKIRLLRGRVCERRATAV